MMGWTETTLGSLGAEVRESVVPDPGTQYVHYSVPSFADGAPVVERGSEIKSSKRSLRAGDLLICRINPRINRVWLVAEHEAPIIGSTEWVVLRLPDSSPVDRRFLLWYLRSPGFRSLIAGTVSGVTGSHTRAKAKDVLKYPVPLPPAEVRLSIVATIERMLSLVEAGQRDATRAGERIVPAVRSLIEAALREAGEAPVKPLGDLATTVRNGGHWRAPEHNPPGTPILRISAVRPGLLREDEVAYVTAEVSDDERKKFSVRTGSLLFTRYNGNPRLVGACARVPASAAGLLHPDKLIRVDLRQGVLPEWVEIAAAGGATRSHLDAHIKTTSGQAGIAGRDVKSAPVPIPSLDQQRELVDRVHMGRERLRRLSTVTELTQDKGAALRRSILKAAFEGRLTGDAQEERSLNDIQEAIA